MSQPLQRSSPSSPEIVPQLAPPAHHYSLETSSHTTEDRTRSIASRRLPFTEESSLAKDDRFPKFNSFDHSSSIISRTTFSSDEEDAVSAAPASPTMMRHSHQSAPKRMRLDFNSIPNETSSLLVDRLKRSSEASEGASKQSQEKTQSVLSDDTADYALPFSDDHFSTPATAGSKKPSDAFRTVDGFFSRSRLALKASEAPLPSHSLVRRLKTLHQSSLDDLPQAALQKAQSPEPQAFSKLTSHSSVVDPDLTPSTFHMPPPPTPLRPHLKNRQIKSEFGKKVIAISDTCQIFHHDRPFRISPIRGLYGDHSQIYCLQENQENLLSDVPNQDILIKVFHKDLIFKEHMSVENEFVPNMLRQHDELLRENLGVVRIYNKETVLRDGYFMVEKLRPFRLPWDRTTPLSSFSLEQKKILSEFERFFLYAIQSPSDVALDLAVRNFGLNASGELILLDLMERTESACAFRCIAKKVLADLSGGNIEVSQHLKSLALAIDPSIQTNFSE
jgi:hypothetical protein